jgi:hypothetical protein
VAITVTYSEVWTKDQAAYFGYEAERLLECAWTDRYTLATQILLYPDSIYPHVTCPALAKRCFIEPVPGKVLPTAGDQHKALYEKALVHVYYDTKRMRYVGSALLSEEIIPALDAQATTFSEASGTVVWDAAGSPALDANYITHRLQPAAEYVLTYYFLATIPAVSINLLGFVNNESYVTKGLGITFAPQTLLYQGGRISETILTDGTVKYHVSHRCAYRPNWAYSGGWFAGGWNYFWNPEGEAGDGSGTRGAFQRIIIDGDVYRKYPAATFGF